MNRTLRRDWLVCLLLLAVTVSAYWPVTTHDFINYDDPLYVTANPQVKAGLTMPGVAWAFGRVVGEGTYWHPITWLSHMLDCQLFGVRPGWHHATNLLFHAANVLLLFLALKRMTGAVWRSAMVAALFALHPLQVDSVAWVAERKNLLSTFFFLLLLLSYDRFARRRDVRRYLLVVVVFALGLMSKPMLVTAPCLLLLLDYWPWMRIDGFKPQPKDPPETGIAAQKIQLLALEKVPLLALSAVSCAITILAHERLNLLATGEQLPVGERLAHAMVSYVTYLGKIFWPANLAVFYPHPGAWPIEQILLSAFVLAGLSGLALWGISRRPHVFVGWCWFLGMLVPVIGVVQAGIQSMADRFMYIPIIGIFIAIVWSAAELVERWRVPRRFATAAAVTVLAATFAVTWRQVGYWKDSETLFGHAVKVTRDNFVAMLNYGVGLGEHGKLEEAAAQYREALRVSPGYPLAECNLGNVYGLQHQYDEAIAHYRIALEHKPDYAEASFNWANALALQGKYDEAIPRFREALRLHPDYPEAHNNLGNALMLAGRINDAVVEYTAAVALRPDFAEAQCFLGRALAHQKRFPEAVSHFRIALKLRPNESSMLNDLAWILATEPDTGVLNVPEAIQLARRACDLDKDTDPMHLDTLAVAYSEAGQFPAALDASEKSIRQARAAGEEALAKKLETHENAFRAAKSYSQVFGPKSAR